MTFHFQTIVIVNLLRMMIPLMKAGIIYEGVRVVKGHGIQPTVRTKE